MMRAFFMARTMRMLRAMSIDVRDHYDGNDVYIYGAYELRDLHDVRDAYGVRDVHA